MKDPGDYSDDELRDAASKVDRRLYPERAKALIDELKRRTGAGPNDKPLLDVFCGARIGWVYYDYPGARFRLYHDRVEVTTLLGHRHKLPLDVIADVCLEREIFLKWLQLRHTDSGTPELAVWSYRIHEIQARVVAAVASIRVLESSRNSASAE